MSWAEEHHPRDEKGKFASFGTALKAWSAHHGGEEAAPIKLHATTLKAWANSGRKDVQSAQRVGRMDSAANKVFAAVGKRKAEEKQKSALPAAEKPVMMGQEAKKMTNEENRIANAEFSVKKMTAQEEKIVKAAGSIAHVRDVSRALAIALKGTHLESHAEEARNNLQKAAPVGTHNPPDTAAQKVWNWLDREHGPNITAAAHTAWIKRNTK
jgi:hypothetical protein